MATSKLPAGCSFKEIFRFWRPLLVTWTFMSLELVFLAAFIAHLPMQKENLAAYGLCLSLLLLFESPLLSIVSAAVALITDHQAYRKLLHYTMFAGGLMSCLMLLLLLPGPFDVVVEGWIGVEPGIADLLHRASRFMVLCPFAVGYRRLYQGVLVRSGRTGLVSLGTVIRISTLIATCFIANGFFHIDGAVIGGIALGIGMSVEAIYARLAAEHALRGLLPEADPPGVRTFQAINRFYLPLALSTVIGLAAQPILSALVARSPQPIESLAVIPVINSLVILFRSIGFSYQEVVIAFLTVNPAFRSQLRKFGALAAVSVGALFSCLTFSSLMLPIYQRIGGLAPDLAQFAVFPTRLLTVLPMIGVWLFMMRGEVIYRRRTGLITLSCAADVAALLGFMALNIAVFNLPGAEAAAAAGLCGIICGAAVLWQTHWSAADGHPSPSDVALHTTQPPLEMASE